MIFFGRIASLLAAALAGLLAFLFGWRLDGWIEQIADIPSAFTRIRDRGRRAACHFRPGFGGGLMIEASRA